MSEIIETNLFGDTVETSSKPRKEKSPKNIISVNYMNYIKSQKTTWEDLYTGYDDIKILTYSFGLPFVSELIKPFKTAEIIVSPSSIRADAVEIMTAQAISCNIKCKEPYLQERIKDGTFHLYCAKDIISHGKVYLLKNESGAVRTILGSANASKRAWNGAQAEEYVICDDPAFYEHLLGKYKSIKDASTDEITIEAKQIEEDGSNIDDIPMIKKIQQVKTAVVIHDAPEPEKEVEYVFIAKDKLSKSIREALVKSKIRPTIKNDGTLLSVEKIKNVIKIAKNNGIKKKEREIVCPQLELDYMEQSMYINDALQNLNPSEENVKSDISLWLQYFKGFDCFNNDVGNLKEKAWKVLVHMFASPFFARLRYEGYKADIPYRMFPIYLLFYGQSDNGKTALIKTIQKLMLNIVPKPVPTNFFSSNKAETNNIYGLEQSVKGCPILIDDIGNYQWRSAADITKNDTFIFEEGYINAPTFIMTANELSNIKPEISKRLVVFYVANQLSKNEAAKKDQEIKAIRNKMSNSWYCEYVSKMYPLVEDMCNKMMEPEKDLTWQPDIYQVSSTVLLEILHKYTKNLPKEFVPLTWNDFMGDAAVSERAINKLKEIHYLNPDLFKANKDRNEIILDLSPLSDKDELMKRLKELPADLERREIGTTIAMKLDETEYYTGIKFKKGSWFSKLFNL